MVAAAIVGGAISAAGSVASGALASSGAGAAAGKSQQAEQYAIAAQDLAEAQSVGYLSTAQQQAAALTGAGTGAATQAIAGGLQAAIPAEQTGINNAVSADWAGMGAGVQAEQAYGATALGNLQPFINMGTSAGNQLTSELQSGKLGGPAPLDQATIANMPGYQFALQQGLMSTQNAQAAQGLGVSGNALGAASQYAVGLANQNFQNYFSDYWANQNNRYNMLANTTSIGQNAATSAGADMTATGQMIGNTYMQGTQNVANAYLQGGQMLGNTYTQGAQNLGSAFLQGSQMQGTALTGSAQNIANALQSGANANTSTLTGSAAYQGNAAASQASTQAQGITGASGSIGNALLLNQLLNKSSGNGGSVISSGLDQQPVYNPS